MTLWEAPTTHIMENYDYASEEAADFAAFIEKQLDAGYCVYSYLGCECTCDCCQRQAWYEQVAEDMIAAGVEF